MSQTLDFSHLSYVADVTGARVDVEDSYHLLNTYYVLQLTAITQMRKQRLRARVSTGLSDCKARALSSCGSARLLTGIQASHCTWVCKMSRFQGCEG